jgi:glycosyltransferase involved in cell wall biosynthesis
MKYEYPDISVVLTTYNRPAKLRRALCSVLAQDIKDATFEVLVVDDASDTDNVAVLKDLEKHFALRHIPLLYYKLGENSGYHARPHNVGVQHSVGEFIAYLDDDNVWRPNHLRVLWEAIRRHDCDMVYCTRAYLKDEGFESEMNLVGVGLIGPFNAEAIKLGNYIDTSDILHAKGAYYRLATIDGKGWDEDLMRFGDWNFVYRWALAGLTARPVYQVLTDYYWHGENLQLVRKPDASPISLDNDVYAESRRLQSNAG